MRTVYDRFVISDADQPHTERLFTKVRIAVWGQNFATQHGMFKYFIQATCAIVIWDHLITLSDEVEHACKKEQS